MRVWPRRSVVVLAVLAVVALVVGAASAFGVLRRSYAGIEGEGRLLGLDSAAEVLRDAYGVPHIYASTSHDLFFLQGYVTAQDRLFQMEFHRRIGQGRLSELFGAATLDSDRFLRTLGIYRVAEAEAEILRPDSRAALQAYADGVNKFAETHRESPPVEFVLLGVGWEPWRLADTVVVGKIMAWDLGGNMSTELVRADAIARLGEEAARVLFPGVPTSTPAILSSFGPVRIRGEEELRALLGSVEPSGLGSNNWVLAGSRTTTGAPLLANDIHLGIRNPSIWYQVHLAGAGFDVVGFSIPGAPGVIVGHNARIAWGVTNLGPDVQDLYVEQPNPRDLREFRFRDAFEAARVRREEVVVRGREPDVLEVTVTRHGPVLTPVLEGTKQELALRWTALDPGRLLDAVFALQRASNWIEFRAALRAWDVPGQNFVYADLDGHIGYQMTGRIPIRAKGDGLVPAPGWSGDYEWVGFIPFDELPSRLDPPEGLIVTANQRVVAAYPHLISSEFDPGFRAQRINDLLRSKARLSPEDLARIQMDVTDLAVERFLPTLRQVEPRSPQAAAALTHLRDWDSGTGADSVAAAIYQVWFRYMVERTFRDKLGDALYRQYLGSGRVVTLALAELARTPDSPWFVQLADATHGGRQTLAALALEDAVAELERSLGPDQSRWRWGRLHAITFGHPLGARPPLDRIFNLGPYPNGGDLFTVAAAPYSLRSGRYEADRNQRAHVSMRMIVDLADLDRSLSIYPTGQSGQPFAKHWGDMTSRWLAGELLPLRYSREKLGPIEGRLAFRPR